MDLPINAPIVCTDGSFGRSIAIILNPVTDQVTHLVVREPGLLGVKRMLSVAFVTESTPDLICLRCTTNELAHMPPFISTSYILALPSSAGMLLWPYVTQSEISIAHENTPLDELAVHRGSRIHATDGHIGEVEEFVISPVNNGITHVILREGHFWNRQDVTIPIAQIGHIDEDNVYLTLNKHQIAALPAIAVHRPSRSSSEHTHR